MENSNLPSSLDRPLNLSDFCLSFEDEFNFKWNYCIKNKILSFNIRNVYLKSEFRIKNSSQKHFVYCVTDILGKKFFSKADTGLICINRGLLSLDDYIPEIQIFPLTLVKEIFDNTIEYQIFLMYKFMIANHINVLGGYLGSEIEDNPVLLNHLLIRRHKDNLKLLKMGIQYSNPEMLKLAQRSLDAMSTIKLNNDGELLLADMSKMPKMINGNITYYFKKAKVKYNNKLLPVLNDSSIRKFCEVPISKNTIINKEKYLMSNRYFERMLSNDYADNLGILKKKYGITERDYFVNKSCKTVSKNLRAKEGLILHHDNENKCISLSSHEIAINHSFQWQRKDNLTYCNYLEHMILHLLIFEEYTLNEDEHMLLGIGGIVNFMVPIGDQLIIDYNQGNKAARTRGEYQKCLFFNQDKYFKIIGRAMNSIVINRKVPKNIKFELLYKMMHEPLKKVSVMAYKFLEILNMKKAN